MPANFRKTLNLRHDRMEFQTYEDSSFPVEIYDDRFSDFYGMRLPCHWHDVVELDLMAEGSAIYRVDGVEVPLEKGDLLIISPGEMHLAESHDAGSKVIGVTFAPRLIAGQEDSLLYLRYFLPLLKNRSYIRLTDETCNCYMKDIYYGNRSDPFFALNVLDRLIRIWRKVFSAHLQMTGGLATEHSMRQSMEMKSMLSYMHEHYSERLQVSDLCRAGNVSRSECFRLFEKYSLFSPMGYLNDFRLNKAAVLLEETDRSVAEVASDCGFDNQSYFSLQFRKHFGVTPARYRSRNRHP